MESRYVAILVIICFNKQYECTKIFLMKMYKGTERKKKKGKRYMITTRGSTMTLFVEVLIQLGLGEEVHETQLDGLTNT